jgi:hypothetical protein
MVDISPDPDEGMVAIRARTSAGVLVDILSGDALNAAIADGEQLYMLHARTCPARKPFNPRPDHVKLHLPPPKYGRPKGRPG